MVIREKRNIGVSFFPSSPLYLLSSKNYIKIILSYYRTVSSRGILEGLEEEQRGEIRVFTKHVPRAEESKAPYNVRLYITYIFFVAIRLFCL